MDDKSSHIPKNPETESFSFRNLVHDPAPMNARLLMTEEDRLRLIGGLDPQEQEYLRRLYNQSGEYGTGERPQQREDVAKQMSMILPSALIIEARAMAKLRHPTSQLHHNR